jgi:alanine dehydrogenase
MSSKLCLCRAMALEGLVDDRTHIAETLLLTRREIAALMTPADYRHAVEAAFRACGEGLGATPAPMHIEGADGGAFHVKGAGFPAGALAGAAGGYVAFKVNGNFPQNRARNGLPTIQGTIVLCDGSDGRVLALMDSIEITLQRTAAASAVAAERLARPQSRCITICGCGDQALPQLAALRDVLPLDRGFAWDQDPARARVLAAAAADLGIAMETARDLASATLESDVIVTCTTARVPFLGPEHVRAGTFVAAVGADSPDKSELLPALFRDATAVADVRAQAIVMGDLRHALAAGAMAAGDIHAELGEVVCGRRPGRTREAEITIFDSTGSAIQDVASAAVIFELARARGLGQAVALGRGADA